MVRGFVALALIVLLTMVPVFSEPVDAGKGWCRSDPLFRVGNTHYAAVGGSSAKMASATYVIKHPSNLDAELITEYPGIAEIETTVFQPVAPGSPVTITLVTVPKPGLIPDIELITAKRPGHDTQRVTGKAGQPISVTYPT